jgi:hypothetical protein
MKSLSVAILIALSISAILFGIFNVFGVGTQVAAPLASSSLSLITFIHDKVDKAFSAGKSRVNPGIVPVSGFDIHWPFMLVHVTLITIGMCELANFVYAIPSYLLVNGESSSLGPNALFLITALFSMPAIAWGVFLLGRWTGIRAAKRGYWILPVGFCIGRGLEDLVIFGLLPGPRRFLLEGIRTGPGVISLIVTFCMVLGFGIFGVWRGNRVRLGAYFNSLLRQVPESTRATLLSMTYDEAKGAKAAVHDAVTI